MRIEICGVIAAGKSSLAKTLEQLGYSSIYEDFSAIAYLNDFYSNPSLYSFETEIAFLLQHMYQVKKKSALSTNLVCDYSFEQDFAYAKNNLCDSEFTVFELLFQEIKRKLNNPALIILLECDSNVLLERIKSRGRENEKGISLEYLNNMSSMIENHLKGISTPILKFNTNHFDFRNIDTVRKTIVPLISELDLKI